MLTEQQQRETLIEEALKHYAPKCCVCGNIATRSYRHIADVGNSVLYGCDNDGCLTDDYCGTCKADWDGGFCTECGNEEAVVEFVAYDIRPLLYAELLKAL